MKRDYYEILGLQKGANADAIKKAYRKLAMQYHPDQNPGDKAAEEKFKECAEAYEILSDDDKRARYDRLGHAAFEGGGGYSGGAGAQDIFEQFAHMFGGSDFFGGGFGQQQQQRTRGQRGSDLRVKIKLNLQEIANGVNKKIKVNKDISCTTCRGSGAKDASSVSTCNTCRGSGYVRKVTNTMLGQMQTTVGCPTCSGSGQQVTAKCGTCKGDGVTKGEDLISIDIPAGVADGMQLSMSGRGNSGRRGGPSGDLLINITEEAHESLHRDGNNLIYDLQVNFADAALGSECIVPTIDGQVKIKIPAGTPAGHVFRLRDKGIPELQGGYRRGDLLVHLSICMPKDISREGRELLEKLRNLNEFKPNGKKGDRGFLDRMKDLFQ